MDLSVVLCFFSPAEYELPRKHFLATMGMLREEQKKNDFEVIVSQVISPTQKTIDVPESFFSDWYKTSHVMFYKENLWNLATTRTQNSNFIFLDSDVFFRNSDWIKNSMAALESAEVIQPFEFCEWLAPDQNRIEKTAQSAVEFIIKRKPMNCELCHPGFAWGCTREGWNKLGGWFDLNVAGSGDTATALALAKEKSTPWGLEWFTKNQDNSPAWAEYRKKIQSQEIKLGYARGNRIVHRWHGTKKNRQYLSRYKLFPRSPDGNHPIHKNKNGLLQWNNPEHNEGPRKYFEGRHEDG